MLQLRRALSVGAVAALAGFGSGYLTGCGLEGDDEAAGDLAAMAELRACKLDDGSIEKGARLHACDPQNAKKTTVCHIPPGNPANAHTICVGNAAVPAHLTNHGDYLGACRNETPCQPPTGAGGASGAGGAAGQAGAGGAAGDPVVP